MKYILSLILLFVATEITAQKQITINYIGFYQDVFGKNRVSLEFEIRNSTNDTIYLSEDKLKLIVYKNGKQIKEEKLNYGGHPFIRPRLAECKEKNESRNILCSKFAIILVKKNNVETELFRELVNDVETKCIVILPNELVYYKKIFFQSKFDKNCEVEMKYSKSNTFTRYKTESENIIELKE